MSGKIYPEAEFIKSNLTIEDYFNFVICKNNKSVYGSSVSFYNTPAVICPLHSENTGSFRYYEETNSFYCFGCGRGGDVIKLHQYYYEINYGIKKRFGECVNDLLKIISEHNGKTIGQQQGIKKTVKDRTTGSVDESKTVGTIETIGKEVNIASNSDITGEVTGEKPGSKEKLAFVLEENRVYRFVWENVKEPSEIVHTMKHIEDIRSLFLDGSMSLEDAVKQVRRQIKVML